MNSSRRLGLISKPMPFAQVLGENNMSDRVMLALSVDIFRNLANLLFLATVVLLVVAIFKHSWAWVGYAFGSGVVLRLLAMILRGKLYASR